MARKKTTDTTATNNDNNEQAASIAAKLERAKTRVVERYGEANPKALHAQRESGVNQVNAALLLHSCAAASGKTITEARKNLMRLTGCLCLKGTNQIKAQCIAGDSTAYSEPAKFGFLYGTVNGTSLKPSRANLNSAIDSEYGALLCAEFEVDAAKVKAHVAEKLEVVGA